MIDKSIGIIANVVGKLKRRRERAVASRLAPAGQACSQLTQDARWAVRSLRRRPIFTAVVALMLGVGIGLNAAIFAVVDAALFKGFRHVQRNDRLVRVSTSRDVIYYPDFEEWRAQSGALADLALVRGVFHTLRAGDSTPLTVFTMEVTPNTFRLLGVAPAIGRDFRPEDVQPGADPVVVLRHDLWVRLFQGSGDVVGRRIPLDGVATTVIGVMPEGFAFPAEQEIWTPLVPTAAAMARETPYARYAYGRLRDGVSVDAARTELQTIGRRLAMAFPATNQLVIPTVSGFDDWFVGGQSRALYLGVWGAAACVLLIVCGNVANLFVLHAIGRGNELLLQQALGASPARLVRQTALEAGLLAMAGGSFAWWVAGLALDALRGSQVFPPMLAVSIDVTTFGYVWALSAAAACVIGGATAVHLLAGRSQPMSARTVTGSPRGAHLVHVFVSLQVALATVLIVSAGMLVHMLVRITNAGAGIDAANIVTASLYLPPERYHSDEARLAFFRALEERLSSSPEVATVGFAEVAPTERTPRRAIEIDESSRAPATAEAPTAVVVVTPGYFRALGATVVEGRDTEWTDDGASGVVLVNQRFAERHWPDASPIGRRLRFGPSAPGATPGDWLTVVGMTSNIVQNDATRQEYEPVVYVPYVRRPQSNMFAFVRSRATMAATANAIRASVFALDPALPVPALAPIEARLSRAHALERQMAATLSGFSSLALILAAVGMYAVAAQAVTRRMREIGIRRAVGATRRHIVSAVAAGQLRPLALGVGAGLVLSAGAARLLASRIAGVQASDPLVAMLAATVLAVAAVCGFWFPVRRALRADPAVVLKQE